MEQDYSEKSSVSAIRERFDSDVERFSSLETGQRATIDAPLAMELITRAAVSTTVSIGRVLDLGCGASNNMLKLRAVLGSDLDGDLLDLSRPMVERNVERVRSLSGGTIRPAVGDLRDPELPDGAYDVRLTAGVPHHLRDRIDKERTFARLHRLLRAGSNLWITDLVTHSTPGVEKLMW